MTDPLRGRLTPVRQTMTIEEFRRLPRRLGWKHEYYDGAARLRPGSTFLVYRLDVSARPAPDRPARPVEASDRDALVALFVDAFAATPDFAGYPDREYREWAADYVREFLEMPADERPAAFVTTGGGAVTAAALTKRYPKGVWLDCVMAHPDHGRGGLATAVATAVVNDLSAAGVGEVFSRAHLANAASQAWHERFGFREVPGLMATQARMYFYAAETRRCRDYGEASPGEADRFAERADFWRSEYDRLRQRMRADPEAGWPELDG